MGRSQVTGMCCLTAGNRKSRKDRKEERKARKGGGGGASGAGDGGTVSVPTAEELTAVNARPKQAPRTRVCALLTCPLWLCKVLHS